LWLAGQATGTQTVGLLLQVTNTLTSASVTQKGPGEGKTPTARAISKIWCASSGSVLVYTGQLYQHQDIRPGSLSVQSIARPMRPNVTGLPVRPAVSVRHVRRCHTFCR